MICFGCTLVREEMPRSSSGLTAIWRVVVLTSSPIAHMYRNAYLVGNDMRRLVRDADNDKRVSDEPQRGLPLQPCVKLAHSRPLDSFLSTRVPLRSHISCVCTQNKGNGIASEYEKVDKEMDRLCKTKDWQAFVANNDQIQALFRQLTELLSDVPDEL